MYHLFLVLGHFAVAAILVTSANWWPLPWNCLVVGLPGILLAVWAWRTVGLRKLRVQPSVVEATRFLQTGPYAIVRHPMYTGLLWFTASIVAFDLTVWRAALWLVLLGILLAKAAEEERSMLHCFPEYAQYRRTVRRIVPFVW